MKQKYDVHLIITVKHIVYTCRTEETLVLGKETNLSQLFQILRVIEIFIDCQIE